MHEKEHVIQVLEQTKEAIRNDDVLKLKDLSNQTIHSASTEQDTDSITIAIVIYSLSKIIERKHQYGEKECREFSMFAFKEIDNVLKILKKDGEGAFTKSLEGIMKRLAKSSSEFKSHINEVFEKARINKASKIYEHGISMEQTAKLLGISMYELASYAGQKGSANVPYAKTMSVRDRIKIAMDFFG
ncbi:hypothetical protein HYT25_00720 [Candidatus Pacearchaeota archaeon]|nr:hypothetical protein [Candidatus Pacearchaeota archaeon]